VPHAVCISALVAGAVGQRGAWPNAWGCCRCRSAIEKLRAQNEQLKTDLLMENKFSVRPGDPFAQQLINRLQDEGDMLARKVRRQPYTGHTCTGVALHGWESRR
jgi:hypothetical protein